VRLTVAQPENKGHSRGRLPLAVRTFLLSNFSDFSGVAIRRKILRMNAGKLLVRAFTDRPIFNSRPPGLGASLLLLNLTAQSKQRRGLLDLAFDPRALVRILCASQVAKRHSGRGLGRCSGS
jgi:hypothetical protein